MLKSVLLHPYTCIKCLRRQLQRQRNHIHSTSKFSEYRLNSFNIPNHINPSDKYDDSTLRLIFDSPGIWEQFSLKSKSGINYGLFQNRFLTKPQGFHDFASSNLKKAQKLVNKVLTASNTDEYDNIVKDLDRLSDLICRVIDLSDFVRATHPDPEMQNAATQAFSMMYEYMNILNTTRGLADQLNIAMKQAIISSKWDKQEMMVAEILKRDFEKSAISLEQSQREKFVSLSQEISEIGQDFVEKMMPKEKYLTFSTDKMRGMNPMLVKKFSSWGQITMPSTGHVAIAALQTVQDEEVRKAIFIASRTSAEESVERLQLLLQRRAELARLAKFESYAHMTLGDKMAKSPEVVNVFLKALSEQNKGLVVSELEQLVSAKRNATKTHDTYFKPWDKEYYMYQILSETKMKLKRADFLESYFSLGRVMQGLSRLFSRLFGIRLVPCETFHGETWHPDVRRLDVISEKDGLIAVLYCDLFSRPGKTSNPAHFTLRCSRHIPDSEIEEMARTPNSLFEDAIKAANDGMATVTSSDGMLMQIPTIALICDFLPNTRDRPCLLSFSEYVTLYHEMGHAIHSSLGRTKFQNVSGTRCATDFAELPSVLMEYFAVDPNVLGLFAEHFETGEKLNPELVKEKLNLNKKFEGCETESQILLALLDQSYHSSAPADPNFDSSKIYLDIQKKYGFLPIDMEGTSWQGFFGHLFGYGSMYYSYLFDKTLAKRTWEKVFDNGNASTTRGNGEKFKEEVLQWGGARDPWESLSSLLKDHRLEAGGKEAMSLVGSWGIR